MDPLNWMVYGGITNLSEACPVVSRPEKVILHPEWKGTANFGQNDLALIKLKISMRGPQVQVVALPAKNSKPDVGTVFTVSGHGYGTPQSLTPQSLLQFTQVTVVDANECIAKLGAKQFVDEKQICVKASTNSHLCGGDSGNGLVNLQSKVLIGLHTGSTNAKNCKDPNSFLININIAYFTDWIRNEISK